MRNSIFLILCLFFLSLFFSCKKETNLKKTIISKSKIEVLDKEFNFGKKNTKDTILHTYLIKNISNIPYKISKVGESCGCTTTRYTREQVFKDEYAKIEISYIPNSDDSGQIVKSIVVSDNSVEGFNVFYLKGEIIN